MPSALRRAQAKARGKNHIGFKRLNARLASKGAVNSGALAAYIGRKKYGAAEFAAMAAAGRKKAAATRGARKK